MAITATYIGQSTIKVTNSFAVASGLNNMTPFMKFAHAVADAISGARPSSTSVTTHSAGTFVVGNTYIITEVGTTDFTTIGAANNSIGTSFVATGIGIGTGKAQHTIVYAEVPATLSGLTFGVTPGVTPQLSSGWELFDSFWGDFNALNQRGIANLVPDDTDTESPIYTQVFRSLNSDGVTYKNIIVRYNTVKMEILTTTCETWEIFRDVNNNIINRVITNEAWTFMDCAPVGYNLTSCDMLVMVSPHWCVFHSYLNDEPSLWSGVFENVREDVLDTADAGNPCWGWVASTLWMLGATNLNQKPLTGRDYTLWSMPRTKQGYTGFTAAKSWGADYGAAFHPHWLGLANAAFIYYLGNSSGEGNKFTTSGWDPTRKLAMPVKPISDFDGTTGPLVNYGGIYGLKVIAPSGANMNKIIIPTDRDGNSSPNGVERYHWLLNNHFKRQTSDVASWGGNTTWSYAVYSVDQGARPELFATSGCAHYIVDHNYNRITRLIASTGERKVIFPATGVLVGSTITDMKYDGQRFLYVTTTTGLSRVDTANDMSIQSVTVTGGFRTLAITGDSVVCSIGTSNTTPIFYRYKRADQNVTGNPAIAQQAVAPIVQTKPSTLDTPVLSTPIIMYDMVTDFEGNVWAATTGVSDANNRLIRVGMAPSDTDATILQMSAIPYNGFGGGLTPNNVALQVLDGDTMLIWYAASNTAIVQVQVKLRVLDKANMLVMTRTAPSGACSTLLNNTRMTVEKIDGILFVMPRNSGNANVCFSNSLGATTSVTVNGVVTEVLNAPVVGTDQYGLGGVEGVKALSGSKRNSFIAYDGARIYSNADTGLKIYVNIHSSTNTGGAVIDSTTVGQIAIPS